MSECHAVKCHKPATVRVKLSNNYTYKDRWTPGIDYCDDHAKRVSDAATAQGCRVLVEDLEGQNRSQTATVLAESSTEV